MKKAFTLIELLAVITLLGLIALITFPSVNKSIKNSKEQSLQRTIENIETAARNYGSQYNLGYNVNYTVLELSKIKDAGFLENKAIINPVTNEELSGCVIYRWKEQDKQYEYKYIEPCSIEETVPTMTIAYDNEAINSNGWTNKNMVVNFYGTGDKYLYCVGGTECTPVIEENKPNGSKIITDEGVNVVCAKAVNDLGESDVVCTESIKLDKTAPTIGNITFTGTMGKNSWYTTDVNINIEDGSDSLSGHASTVSSVSSVTSNTKGTMVYLVTTDLAGNSAVNAYNIKVDKNHPTIVAKDENIEVKDGSNTLISNLFTTTFSISGGNVSCNPSNTNQLLPGTHEVICTATGGNGLISNIAKDIKITTDSLVGLLYSQYDSNHLKGVYQDENNSNVYYFNGSKATYNYLWYGGFQWRVLEFDVSKKTATLISAEALTYIAPNDTVWTTAEAYEASWINRWLQEEFYDKLSTDVKNNILDTTYNLDPNGNISSVQTIQKVGLLDEDQFNKYGYSAIGTNGYYYLGSIYDATKFRYGASSLSTASASSSYSKVYGVKPVITISDLTIFDGTGSSSNNYRTSYKSTTTNDVKVGEYINVPTTGTYCGTDNLCTFRVVSKEDNKIKVIYQGTIGESNYQPTATISLDHDVYTLLNLFKETIDSKYLIKENSVFYIGDYPSTATDYKDVQDEQLEANIGLPVVGEMFTGYYINTGWTMNRNGNYARCGYGFSLGDCNRSNTNGVRPVVYLKSGTSALTFTGGEGTLQNPYTLQ